MMRHRICSPHFFRWLSLVTLVALLAGCGRDVRLPEPINAVTIAPYPGNSEPPLLVDAPWLRERAATDATGLVILDSSDLATYRKGHIPGAVHAWWQDTMDPNGAAYGTVLKPDNNEPDPQRLRRYLIEDLGVVPSSQIVVYDNAQGLWAARIVWTLRFLGYRRAAVLDGGLAAWRGVGGALESGENKAASVADPPITPPQNHQDWYLITGQLRDRLADPTTLALDVRTDAERSDDIDQTIQPGTIPGSVAVPWTAATADTSGQLLSPEQLRGMFEQAGVTPDRTIVILARFGVETAQTWLVLKLLGYPSVLIYDGGWVEWSQDPDTPKQLLSPQSGA